MTVARRSIEWFRRSIESTQHRPSGGDRRGVTESLRRRAAPIAGHGCSGSPATSTYSRARSDHMYHFRVRKPAQARVAGFPRSNRHLRARAGVSRVPLLSRDFREPVRPMSPTSLISQGSRRVERQFVPVVPVSADLYARTHARTHTHRGSLKEAVQPVHGTLFPDQDRFHAGLLPVHEVEHRVPTIGEAARISPLNWGFRGVIDRVPVPRNPVQIGATKNPPGSGRSSGDHSCCRRRHGVFAQAGRAT
jgi:hypothetical protein